MKAKNVLRDEHGPGHVTPAGRSVFYDLFPRDKADELVLRATLLSGLERWLKKSKLGLCPRKYMSSKNRSFELRPDAYSFAQIIEWFR